MVYQLHLYGNTSLTIDKVRFIYGFYAYYPQAELCSFFEVIGDLVFYRVHNERTVNVGNPVDHR